MQTLRLLWIKKKTLKYLKKYKKVLLSVDIDYSTKNNFTINYE